ncbi:hypothetical protein ABIC12_004718 [Pantoea agglomerans]|jgi:transposase|nr:hypothetical protein [Pantoea agglomerans]
MIKFPRGSRIWPVAGVTDIHCSLNGLAATMHKTLRTDSLSGHLFYRSRPAGRHDKSAVG